MCKHTLKKLQFHKKQRTSKTYNNNNNLPYQVSFIGSRFLIVVMRDSHSMYSIDNNPLLVKIFIFAYNIIYVCIGLCFFNKVSQLAHTICISCITLRSLKNAFQLAYTIYIPFFIGLCLFYDAYQFQVGNVSIIPYIILTTSLLKWPTSILNHTSIVHAHKLMTSCLVNWCLAALEVHYSCGNT